MVTIWFEPHSTTTDNGAGLASGWNDVDLSDLGRQQVFQPIERSQERGIEVIFSSDLQRAVKSAVPTADALKIPIYIDKRLREWNYGDMTQRDHEQVKQAKIEHITSPFPSGESAEDCMARMKEFLGWLKLNFDGKTVMIVGHRATQHGLEHWINGVDVKAYLETPWTYQPGWKYELQ